MTRTKAYQAVYFGVGGLALAAAAGAACFGLSPAYCLAGLLVMLTPGQLLRVLWRDQLRGLHFLRRREYARSKEHSQRVLEALRRRPWLKRAIWLGTSTYSRDGESLALCNLGAAEIGLGDLGAARVHLEDSMKADPANPLPYYNMAILSDLLGRGDDAVRWFDRAVELGWATQWTDRVVRESQARNAARAGGGLRD